MATFEDLQKELEPHKDSLVLDGFEVVRLLDVVNGEDDYYWVYKSPTKGIYWSSCVGGWAPLKGHLLEKHYQDLERVWKLNEERWDYVQSIQKQQRKKIIIWLKDSGVEWWDWDGRTLLVLREDREIEMYTELDLRKTISDFPKVE